MQKPMASNNSTGTVTPEEEEIAGRRWQQGQPDYMGVSSTDNIMHKLDAAVGKNVSKK